MPNVELFIEGLQFEDFDRFFEIDHCPLSIADYKQQLHEAYPNYTNHQFPSKTSHVKRKSYHRPTCPLACHMGLFSAPLETGNLVSQQNLKHTNLKLGNST